MGRLASGMKRLAAVTAVAMLPAALGCGAFFQCEGKTSCTGGTGGGGTDNGDVVFAANTSSTGIYAYYISGGKMSTVAGEPFSNGFVASAMAVNTTNTFLFAATTTGFIYAYAVSNMGVLSGLAQEAAPGVQQVSMDVSSDGKWLVALGSSTALVPALNIYSMNGETLTLVEALPITSATGTVTSSQVKISPNNDFVAVALSGGGTQIYPFATSSTIPVSQTASPIAIPTGASTSGDNAIAWDSNDNLYIGRSTGSSANTGIWILPKSTLSTTPTATFAVATDSGPRALVFANSDAYLYAANTASGTISGFSLNNGMLTPLGTSTSAPASVNAFAVDSTGLNLLAAGTSKTGLQLYTLSSGALSASNNAATGSTDGAPVLAVTH